MNSATVHADLSASQFLRVITCIDKMLFGEKWSILIAASRLTEKIYQDSDSGIACQLEREGLNVRSLR